MLLQRLATGATGVKQARCLLGAARHSHAHAQYIRRYVHVSRIPPRVLHFSAFIKPRRACAARVTVVVPCVCVCVCQCVQASHPLLTQYIFIGVYSSVQANV